MKKIISLALALLIVISSITTVLLTSASAATNLWTDPTEGFTASNPATTVSYITENAYYQVEKPYYKQFSFKLPSGLSEDKTYRLSFEHCLRAGNTTDGTVSHMNLTKDSTTGSVYGKELMSSYAVRDSWETVVYEFAGTTDQLYLYMSMKYVDWARFRNFTLIEVEAFDVNVNGGTATVNSSETDKAVPGATVTINATAPTGKAFESWEVVSGDVTLADKNSPTTTFTMPKNAVSVKAIYKDNLWTNPTEGFTASNPATTVSYETANAYYQVEKPYYKQFSFKLPSGLSEDKTYRLSFEHWLRPGPENGTVSCMNLTKDSTTGSVYGKELMSSYAVTDSWETVVYEFAGTTDQLYLYMSMNYVYWARFRNFTLIEVDSFAVNVTGGTSSVKRAKTGETVTVTADAPLGKQFKKWEVVSGGVTLDNANATPTTFTMPAKEVSIKAIYENSENLWDGLVSNNFLKLEGNPTFDVSGGVVTENSPWYTKFRIEMPELEKNAVYRLSFDHKIKLDASKVGKEKAIAQVQLMTEAQLQAALDYQAAHPGTPLDIGSQGKKIVGATETTGDWESTISYEFDSGANTVYYVAIATNHAVEAQFRNFKLEKIAINMAPQFDANLGSVTPVAQLAEVGNELTFTATPFKGNTFEGWYKADGQTLLSKEQKIDYFVDDSFEAPVAKFAAGTPAVENAGLENSSGMIVDIDNTTKDKIINDPLYDIQSINPLSWQELKIESNYAHTGSKSLWVYTRYSFAGRTFKNLEKNTDYAISFWLYGANNCKLTVASYVLPAGVNPVADGKEVPSENAIVKGKSIAPDESWREVVVNFNSGENTEVVLWLYSTGEGEFLFVDDFAIYKPAVLEVIGGLGGNVSATASGSLAKGTKVTLTATPFSGNNLKHWLDKNGDVASTDAEFTVTVDTDMQFTAVFDGYNKPGREVFSSNGQDGTFENGTISGWHAVNRDNGNSVSWCTWQRSTDMAYEGAYSLKTYTLYQNSVLPLTGLNTNTDYKFSFYVNYPEYAGMEDEKHKNENGDFVDSRAIPFGILAADETHYRETSTIYADHPYSMPCGGGWYKVDMYFNTGDATAVNFVYAYYGVTGKNPYVYFDNISLFEYISNPALENGDVSTSVAPWLGSATAENGALKMTDTADTAYQTLNLGVHVAYKVSFRAKGKVFAGVSDVSAKVPSIMNVISSESYVETNSDDWKNYSFTFYTGTRPNVNVMFASLDGTAYVDDISITEEISVVGALVEKVDFETERFALRDQNKSAYEIYVANGKNDENVYNGEKSLHFKANSAGNVAALLDEAYLSYGVIANTNYRLTLYYKLSGDGSVYIAPNCPAYKSTIYGITKYGAYCEDAGYEYSGKGWNKVQFTFTAESTHTVKTMISNLLGNTNCDFYIDDITVTVAPDLVTNPDPSYLFCEEFFNVLPNAGFEENVGTNNWVGLPNNMKVVTKRGDADTGKSYLSVSAGQRYVLPINLEAGKIYYFGASMRGDSKSSGRVALATQVDPGNVYFVDANNNDAVASIITAGTDSEWKRKGFAFRANASGVTYLVIECTKGRVDVDTLSLCLEDFKYENDPNRYEAPVKFDYDNIDPDLLVYNGGFDTFGDLTESPKTGDSPLGAIIMITACLVAVATLVLFRRKEVKA